MIGWGGKKVDGEGRMRMGRIEGSVKAVTACLISQNLTFVALFSTYLC